MKRALSPRFATPLKEKMPSTQKMKGEGSYPLLSPIATTEKSPLTRRHGVSPVSDTRDGQ
ncbi:hypothetical protein ES332_A10G158200v1 [Gossypium tomentosum]|uniref:Uncharacterized protein n=1 Tax=Gossypium tomentosum TaxID=34277 RepID=A0A5D2NSA8_GOSTO|nr:hypothetical protein ES332_A10G158200v1 [Gossypium tomentosum]